ncbi:MAG TPA: protein kinase [Anaerolineaceae bacterium]
MTDFIGETIDERYKVTAPLGSGGMAVVYRAVDTRLNRDVAIKFIQLPVSPKADTARAEMEQATERFKREAAALATLSHPNIVNVYDYGKHEGMPYLVMQFISGGRLEIQPGVRTAWREAVKLVLPIARALQYAHEKGIIHRDVKPSNILLTESGDPMLSDFGIAKLVERDDVSLTGTGMGIGTPGYMAPEQWQGTPVPQSDIYALGVILYELVTGRKPYEAPTPIALAIKQATEPLPPPRSIVPNLPAEVERAIMTALAVDPARRFASMEFFANALEALMMNRSISAGQTLGTPDGTRAHPAAEEGTRVHSESATPPPPSPRPVYAPPAAPQPIYVPAAPQPVKKAQKKKGSCGIGAVIGAILLVSILAACLLTTSTWLPLIARAPATVPPNYKTNTPNTAARTASAVAILPPSTQQAMQSGATATAAAILSGLAPRWNGSMFTITASISSATKDGFTIQLKFSNTSNSQQVITFLSSDLKLSDNIGTVYTPNETTRPIRETLAPAGSSGYERTMTFQYKGVIPVDTNEMNLRLTTVNDYKDLSFRILLPNYTNQYSIAYTLASVNGDSTQLHGKITNTAGYDMFLRFTAADVRLSDDVGTQYTLDKEQAKYIASWKLVPRAFQDDYETFSPGINPLAQKLTYTMKIQGQLYSQDFPLGNAAKDVRYEAKLTSTSSSDFQVELTAFNLGGSNFIARFDPSRCTVTGGGQTLTANPDLKRDVRSIASGSRATYYLRFKGKPPNGDLTLNLPVFSAVENVKVTMTR